MPAMSIEHAIDRNGAFVVIVVSTLCVAEKEVM